MKKNIVGVWCDKEQTFLKQNELVQLMIQDVNFQLECLSDEVIDCEDFALAVEQITNYYVELNNHYTNEN
tara:strand:+ start:1261 stop:1470 length:210 start_codon:yes stop_codon:yes gene_type:complete